MPAILHLLAGLMICASAQARSVETVLHVVRRGDTLAALSARYLGRASLWRQLSILNNLADPRHLTVGKKINIQVGAASWQPQAARMVQVQGTASVVRKGKRAAEPLTVGDRVAEGDAVRTAPGSFAALLLSEGSIVHMQADTTLRVSRLRKLNATGATRVNMRLESGRFDAAVTPVLPNGRFQVSTPLAIAGVRGTRFGMTALGNGAVGLDVLEGAVEFGARGVGAKTRVDAGTGATAAPGTRRVALHALATALDLSTVPTDYDRPVISLTLPGVPVGTAVLAQIASDPSLRNVLQSQIVRDRPIRFSTLDDGNYYLAVRVIDNDGVMGQQRVVPIRLKARPEAPWPYSPHSGIRIPRREASLVCTDVQGAYAYDFQLSHMPDFTSLVAEAAKQPTCRWDLSALDEGTYYWRAATIARNSQGAIVRGPYGDASSFVVTPFPVAPEPTLEYDGSTIVRWTAEAGSHYELQIASDPNFTRNVQLLELDEPQAKLALTQRCEYFLRVRTVGASGATSAFSATRRLRASVLCTEDDGVVLDSDGVPVQTGH
ncbi:hypothetical protein J2W35_006460 [Variovorax boronicumulans]|uniref:FecR family protein n=1 Tax=Variovorax boronicumulans TaxID=436515 RepID=UPI00278A0D75|nr:FecR domain-containing protein [Variovorax boronicumulans]MDQ0086079.1 hypothetical protein [Variovorax boronicumulans]